ncbi:glycosyltransferase family 4 protein [Olsenella sp. DSM 107455]|uniref:Glycosyltransferase family 4 protein n=1 Tax=Thermophilibacter gallinarum TaxID=2779357 RepID=A0ABR9QTY9_9ACTN|nr:glycosyltransferase family 4 protein [Thermophilibacter gallinarum]
MTQQQESSITIVVVAHDEGLASFKTWVSLECAFDCLKGSLHFWDVFVVAHQCDETTLRGLRIFTDKGAILCECDRFSLGATLNKVIDGSKSDYIGLLRASDLITSNTISDVLDLEDDGRSVIWHPEAVVEFGTDVWKHLIWLQPEVGNIVEDRLVALRRNPWPGPMFGKRNVFRLIRFVEDVDYLGYVHHAFVADSLAKGICHEAVSETAAFHRILKDEDYCYHYPSSAVCPRNGLMDYWATPLNNPADAFEGLYSQGAPANAVADASGPSLVKRVGLRIGWKLRELLFDGGDRSSDIRRESSASSRLPGWLINAWKAMNAVDNHLWPTEDAVYAADVLLHAPTYLDLMFAEAFHRLAGGVAANLDLLFFTYDPLGAGGTEKVLARYATALHVLHPSWRLAVMRSKPESFPYSVPGDCAFVDFFGVSDGMDEQERLLLMDRLIAYLSPGRLFCFFAGWALGDFSYRWVRSRIEYLLHKSIKVYPALFMNEAVPASERGRLLNLADPFLREIEPVITRIVTDNKMIRQQALSLNPFTPSQIVVHYQPADEGDCHAISGERSDGRLRVLWASRLAPQKRPDIVRQIGLALDGRDDQAISISVFGREQGISSSIFADVKSVRYERPFAGFNDLPVDEFDVFLYTADTDGLPNILLEAVRAGLPIVASNDGGVGEFIVDGITGALVEIEDIDGYVRALEFVRDNPQKASEWVTNARCMVATRHSMQLFLDNVRADIS